MSGFGGPRYRFGVAFLVLASGCLGGTQPEDPSPDEMVDKEIVHDVLAHNSQGFLAPESLNQPALDVVYRLVGLGIGGEPNIGITSQGNVFTTVGEVTMRSKDHGMTWESVHDLRKVGTVPPTSDPMLWVDPVTDRIFTNQMFPVLTCSTMIISDDEGESWTEKPMTCGTPGVDHQKVMTAPPGPASRWPASPLYPNIVYYCYNKIASTSCAISLDGGLNFVYEAIVAPGVAGCGGTNGHPGAAPDGTVYVLMPGDGCDTLTIGVTLDSGLTWTTYDTGLRISPYEIDDEVAVTRDGMVYVLYAGPDNRQYLARSPDRGSTWLGPWAVSPPDVKSTYFEGLVAGDDGRVAFAYLGTRDGRGEMPERVPDTARWHLFYGYTDSANATDPVIFTRQVTPDQDPVQVGCIWVSGFPSGPCRNMLDFIDMSLDADGRPYVAYTEGCVRDCADDPNATGAKSRASEGAVAILDAGPSLYADAGILGSLGLTDRPA